MKKSTKRFVSMMLAASMMFTTVAANPTFVAAESGVDAYGAKSDNEFVVTLEDFEASFAWANGQAILPGVLNESNNKNYEAKEQSSQRELDFGGGYSLRVFFRL